MLSSPASTVTRDKNSADNELSEETFFNLHAHYRRLLETHWKPGDYERARVAKEEDDFYDKVEEERLENGGFAEPAQPGDLDYGHDEWMELEDLDDAEFDEYGEGDSWWSGCD